MDNETLIDHSARALGWVDYPHDSGDGHQYWFTEPDKAPRGKYLHKRDWNPLANTVDAFHLLYVLKLNITHKGTDHWVSKDSVVSVVQVPYNHAYLKRAITECAAKLYLAKKDLTKG